MNLTAPKADMSEQLDWARREGDYHVRDFPDHETTELNIRDGLGWESKVACRSCDWFVAAGGCLDCE